MHGPAPPSPPPAPRAVRKLRQLAASAAAPFGGLLPRLSIEGLRRGSAQSYGFAMGCIVVATVLREAVQGQAPGVGDPRTSRSPRSRRGRADPRSNHDPIGSRR